MLSARFRDLDLVEDCLQDACTRALTAWAAGAPENPAAWLLTVAQRRVLDVLRQRAVHTRKAPLIAEDEAVEPVLPATDSEIPDERLALMTLCAHPALSPESRVALTLRLVGGLTTAEIARMFFVQEATMAARLTRAKKKIAAAKVPFELPGADVLSERLSGIATVIYLIFTEGYAPTSGEALTRPDLAGEAIRLARLLRELAPGDQSVRGLLALMLLHHARRDARADANGDIVLLRNQDRTLWRWDEIDEGRALLESADGETDYVLQAAIAAEHLNPETDWRRIAGLYERLERSTPSPAIRLNRAIAVGEADGPAAALALLDGLEDSLGEGMGLPATRAELLMRLGRHREALAHYDMAIAACRVAPERAFLERRRGEAAAKG